MAALLVLGVIALKWPILHLPYYWDEAGAYFNPALWLSGRELLAAFPGHHPPELFFGHPPLLYLLMAGLFKLFGHAPAVAHLPMILFAATGVLYTYRVGVLLFSREIAIGAAVLLFASPLYFTQSGMFLGDIPVTACGVGAVYYYLRRCRYRYLLFATSAVLIKEHAALLIAILVLADCCRLSGQAVCSRHKLIHGVPLVILGIFFLTQKLATGLFLPNPYFTSNPLFSLTAAKIVFKTAFANYWAFFAQGRFLLTLVAVTALWRFRRTLPSSLTLFALIVGSYVAAYSVIYFIPRYMLIVMPFISLAGSFSVALLVKDRLRYAAAVAVLCLATILFPDLRTRGYDNFETSMQYLDVVSAQREAAAYLERTAAGELIYAPWPLSTVWTDTAFAYVATPLNMTMDPNTPWKYVVFTPQADRGQAEAIAGLLRQRGVEKVAHFERAGKVVEIYSRKLPASGGKGL